MKPGESQPISPFPHEVERDRYNEETVRIVLVNPPVIDKSDDHVPIQKAEARKQENCRGNRALALNDDFSGVYDGSPSGIVIVVDGISLIDRPKPLNT